MSTPQDPTIWGAIKTILAYALAWFASWKVGEVQQLVGVFSALIVGGFAGTQWYVLWRDKISRYRLPPTRPAPLDEGKP